MATLESDDAATRALRWHHSFHASVCDVLEPWAHGTVVRATRYPDYWDYNVVRVEEDPGMSVGELASLADSALTGLDHRRVDFDLAATGEPLRAGFRAAGWKSLRLVWMRHELAPPSSPVTGNAVIEVPYDAVYELRVAWHEEDSAGADPGGYHEHAREVALGRNARVLAVMEGPEPVGFAQLERDGVAAEITQVYVHPDHRGEGLGTAMTRAAIDAADGIEDLWICADDEDRPKELYARLGFRPARTTMEFLLPPNGGDRLSERSPSEPSR